MGFQATHTCRGCGYSLLTISGIDIGMASAVAAIACSGCRQVFVVELDMPPWDVLDRINASPEWVPEGLRCPEHSEHSITVWRTGDPCPRCGEPLSIDPEGDSVCWD